MRLNKHVCTIYSCVGLIKTFFSLIGLDLTTKYKVLQIAYTFGIGVAYVKKKKKS